MAYKEQGDGKVVSRQRKEFGLCTFTSLSAIGTWRKAFSIKYLDIHHQQGVELVEFWSGSVPL